MPEMPWLPCVFKSDFLFFEEVSFSNVDGWYGKSFGWPLQTRIVIRIGCQT